MKLIILFTSLVFNFSLFANENFTVGTFTQELSMNSTDVKVVSLKLESDFANYKKGDLVKAIIYGFDIETGNYNIEIKSNSKIKSYDLDLNEQIRGQVWNKNKLKVGTFLTAITSKALPKVLHVVKNPSFKSITYDQNAKPSSISNSLYVMKGKQVILSTN